MNIQNLVFPKRATGKHFRMRVLLAVLISLGLTNAPKRTIGQSPVDYLYSGKLAEGETALLAKLESNPDDETRFGLGVIQFGRALEHLLQGLNEHGFLTERTFGPVIPSGLRELFPDNANAKPFSDDVFRQMLKTWIADVTKAEKTLAEITSLDVKLRLKPALIQINPAGNGMPVSAAELLELMFPAKQADQGAAPGELAMMFPEESRDRVVRLSLTLDRGDVHWLRGYLHLQAALAEGLLALDFREAIEVGAHRLFEKVETPYTWLLTENRKIPENIGPESALPILDILAGVTQCLDIAVVEPDRCKSMLHHLQDAIDNGREMWTYILAETDDDQEWIPNPRQKGSIDIVVSQEMIDTWLDTLSEAKLVLEGKKLVPFWRDYMLLGKLGDRGVNVRKVFENPPKRVLIVQWFQGTAATPYLETGELTAFADEKFLQRINRVFGSNFVGFAAWFN